MSCSRKTGDCGLRFSRPSEDEEMRLRSGRAYLEGGRVVGLCERTAWCGRGAEESDVFMGPGGETVPRRHVRGQKQERTSASRFP
jgi:hypothetical protein